MSNFFSNFWTQYKEGNPEADVDEIEKIKRKFIKYDTDMSGDINVDELVAMYQDLGQPKNKLECEKIIKQNDKKSSGTIDFYEFLEMTLGPSANLFLKRLLFFKELEKQNQKKWKNTSYFENKKMIMMKRIFHLLFAS